MSTVSPDQRATRGQLQRRLSQEIQALYRQQLGHRSGKVSCQLFNEKLTIIIEESITKPERLLSRESDNALVEQVHADLDEAIRPEMKQLIESILEREVVDLMSDASLETGRTGIIAILSEPPDIRRRASEQPADEPIREGSEAAS